MVIYHGKGTMAARLAAAVHLGLLPPEPPADPSELQRAWELVTDPGPGFPAPDAGPDGPGVERERSALAGALALAGEDGETRILTLNRATAAEVVERAFAGMADLYGFDRKRILLVAVEPGLLAAAEPAARFLCRLGRPQSAARWLNWTLKQAWRPATAAVRRARSRLVHQ
jgi:hypothetical protein